MAVKGVFTSDANIQGTKKGDFAGALLRIHPTGSAPLLALSSGMKSKDAVDTITTWFEENHLSGRHQVTTGANTVQTTIVIDDATDIVAGAILIFNDTAEQVFVTSVSSSTLTISRGFAGTTAATIGSSTTYVQKIATAHEEGSSKPTSVANIGQPKLNYMQLFRNAWDVTGTAKAVQYNIEGPPAKNKADAGLIHAEDIEKACWFGIKTVGIYNSKPFRTMDGILTQISTNDTAAGATIGWTGVNAFLQSCFEKNIKGTPNERIAFCGNTVLTVLEAIARINGTMQLHSGQTEFGMNVHKWVTPFGNISLMTHPLFNESADWTKDLHVLHPGAIEMRWLRRTFHKEYDSDAGVDADFGIYTSELCMNYKAERTGGSLTGFTAGSTS